MKTDQSLTPDRGASRCAMFGWFLILVGLGIDVYLWQTHTGNDGHSWRKLVTDLAVNNGLVVGMGLLFLYIARATRIEAGQKQSYPLEPWRWSTEWGDGVVCYSPKRIALVKSAIGLFLLAVFLPSSLSEALSPRSAGFEGAVGLAVIILILLSFSCVTGLPVAILRWVKQKGSSCLRLTSFPARAGERFAAKVELPPTWPAIGGNQVRLCCLKKIGSGKSARYLTEWKVDQAGLPALQTGEGFIIPVELQLPATVAPTDDISHISWKLYAWSEASPKSFWVEFPVPVWPAQEGKNEQ